MIKFYLFRLPNNNLYAIWDDPSYYDVLRHGLNKHIFHVDEHVIIKITPSLMTKLHSMTGLSMNYQNGIEAKIKAFTSPNIDNYVSSNIDIYFHISGLPDRYNTKLYPINSNDIIEMIHDSDFNNNKQRRVGIDPSQRASSSNVVMENVNGGRRVYKKITSSKKKKTPAAKKKTPAAKKKRVTKKVDKIRNKK